LGKAPIPKCRLLSIYVFDKEEVEDMSPAIDDLVRLGAYKGFEVTRQGVQERFLLVSIFAIVGFLKKLMRSYSMHLVTSMLFLPSLLAYPSWQAVSFGLISGLALSPTSRGRPDLDIKSFYASQAKAEDGQRSGGLDRSQVKFHCFLRTCVRK
jgi:hypothetical protein